MGLSCNINLKSPTNRYIYLVDILDEITYEDVDDIGFKDNQFYIGDENYVRNDENSWRVATDDGVTAPVYEGDMVQISTARVHFPVFSLEVDNNEIVDYILELYTYINGQRVVLITKKFHNQDLLVHKRIQKLKNEYYEYIDIPFINAKSLCYNDEWLEYRHDVLGEPLGVNNTGSIISVSMTPVEYDEGRDVYIKSSVYTGGANGMLMDLYKDDNAKLEMKFINDYKYSPSISCEYTFNNIYDSVKEYLKETYNIYYPIYINFDLVIRDEEDVWKKITSDYVRVTDNYIPKIKFTRNDINFSGWDEYKNGMVFACSMNIYVNINDVPNKISLQDWVPEEVGDKYILCNYVLAEPLFITIEMFKFFIKDDNNYNEKINYKLLDMNVFNITAINKIEKKIINVDRADNYKSNIIRPVFFRASQTDSITINPQVNENIAINLDAYKSKVSAFRLRIEGIDFVEVGRNNSGVIFKVVGAKLPSDIYSGTYYIIDTNNEVVTSGDYNIG